jgi:hypothetical protein
MGSSGVEFDEDNISYGAPRQQQTYTAPSSSGSFGGGLQPGVTINRNDPKMVQWLMKKGLAKSPGAAQGILVVVILLNALITYFVLSYIL